MEGKLYVDLKARGTITIKKGTGEQAGVAVIEQTVFNRVTGEAEPQKNIKAVDETLINRRIAHLQEEIAGYEQMKTDAKAAIES